MAQLTNKEADIFANHCNDISDKATNSELYKKAVLRVAAEIIWHEYCDEHLANDVLDLIPETQENED